MNSAGPGWLDRRFSGLIRKGSSGTDRQLRLYLGFVFALFVPATMVFAWVDWVRGERATALLVAAIGLILISSIRTLRHARDIRWGYRMVLSSASVLLTLILFLGGGGGFAVVWYYAFPLGFYYVFGAREGSVWALALFAPAAVILLTGAGAAYPPELAHRFVATYALTSALALGLQLGRDAYLGELERERAELKKALADVRALSGMLPMCAWCRKVRNDEGYWSRIEEYLRDHASTLVSHGVCEECAARMEAGIDAELGDGVGGALPGRAG